MDSDSGRETPSRSRPSSARSRTSSTARKNRNRRSTLGAPEIAGDIEDKFSPSKDEEGGSLITTGSPLYLTLLDP